MDGFLKKCICIRLSIDIDNIEVGISMRENTCIYNYKGALTRYGTLSWESAHAWNLIILCLLIA